MDRKDFMENTLFVNHLFNDNLMNVKVNGDNVFAYSLSKNKEVTLNFNGLEQRLDTILSKFEINYKQIGETDDDNPVELPVHFQVVNGNNVIFESRDSFLYDSKLEAVMTLIQNRWIALNLYTKDIIVIPNKFIDFKDYDYAEQLLTNYDQFVAIKDFNSHGNYFTDKGNMFIFKKLLELGFVQIQKGDWLFNLGEHVKHRLFLYPLELQKIPGIWFNNDIMNPEVKLCIPNEFYNSGLYFYFINNCDVLVCSGTDFNLYSSSLMDKQFKTTKDFTDEIFNTEYCELINRSTLINFDIGIVKEEVLKQIDRYYREYKNSISSDTKKIEHLFYPYVFGRQYRYNSKGFANLKEEFS